MTGDEEDEAVLQAALAAQIYGPVPIMLGREKGYALVGTLQLAMRHPEFAKTGISESAKDFCDFLIAALATGDDGGEYPLVRQMLEAGYHPDSDTAFASETVQ